MKVVPVLSDVGVEGHQVGDFVDVVEVVVDQGVYLVLEEGFDAVLFGGKGEGLLDRGEVHEVVVGFEKGAAVRVLAGFTEEGAEGFLDLEAEGSVVL